MQDEERPIKFGSCPWCKQERMLCWVLGRKKNSDGIWSGWVCAECLEKAQEADEEDDK